MEPRSWEASIYKNEDFKKFALRAKPNGRIVWLSCLGETAAFYGWDKTFPDIYAFKSANSPDGRFPDPGRKGWTGGGGIQHRICRSTSTTGWPRGMTNSFRVSKDATRADLQAIAAATTVDWVWMTCKFGGRKPKRWWLEDTTTAG